LVVAYVQAGVSALPVLDEQGGLIDIYARADITALAAANAYNRLQWEDVTVGQALRLGVSNPCSEALCMESANAGGKWKRLQHSVPGTTRQHGLP
jgi:CBS-domain-containing membrane protein